MLVNIANESPKAWSVSDRVKYWCKQSERHLYIGRGSPFGNPYSHLPNTAAQYIVGCREEAVAKYREYLLASPELLARLSELKRKILGCWCRVPKELCHGNVLIEIFCNTQCSRN